MLHTTARHKKLGVAVFFSDLLPSLLLTKFSSVGFLAWILVFLSIYLSIECGLFLLNYLLLYTALSKHFIYHFIWSFTCTHT